MSCIWSLWRMSSALFENKSVHRNREKKEEAEQNLRRRKLETRQSVIAEGCCKKFTAFWRDNVGDVIALKMKYVGIPVIKVLPSILFRLGSIWLILSYCSEFYPSVDQQGPGWGLVLPALLIFIIMAVNFYVSTSYLKLKKDEALVNSVCNVIHPTYVDLYFQVRNIQTM